MPKSQAKKRTVKAKAAATAKRPSKVKRAPAKKAAPPASPRGFMWKLLEEKQARQRAHERGPAPVPPARGPVFVKFAGPRRRAG